MSRRHQKTLYYKAFEKARKIVEKSTFFLVKIIAEYVPRTAECVVAHVDVIIALDIDFVFFHPDDFVHVNYVTAVAPEKAFVQAFHDVCEPSVEWHFALA